MLTEYEMRCRITEVQNSSETPYRKAKSLLRLSRDVRRRAAVLRAELRWLASSPDTNSTACLRRLATRTTVLDDDLRDAALESLSAVRRNTSG